ncbi:MAG: C-GCAxxG-C-C family protein [Clostridiales bacterium]|jgi:C_GCAxxG_C_C family probable redox protein|nr:C-GCAxxG-C-C family protein [Clostridiales bacterium]
MNEKEKASQYFNAGYNCAESVLMAFADAAGFTPETAKRIASGFGGGAGGTHAYTCGALSAAIIVLGCKYGGYAPDDAEGKRRLYGKIRSLMNDFETANLSVNCGELLKILTREKSAGISPSREAAERPCCRFVASACEILTDKWK